MANVSLSAAAQLPLTRSIRHAIRRHKQYTGNPHPIHQDVATMVVPDELKVTSTGDDFLLFDFGPNIGNRIMIFSAARNLDILYNSPHWFADGTFKIVPELFFQHYTIDVLREGSLVTCVYALLSKKTREHISAAPNRTQQPKAWYESTQHYGGFRAVTPAQLRLGVSTISHKTFTGKNSLKDCNSSIQKTQMLPWPQET